MRTDTVSEMLLPVPCRKSDCTRRFKSNAAESMHYLRIHGKGWDTGQNFRSKGKTEDQIIAHRKAQQRKHNKAYRERNLARGLTASGKVRQTPLYASQTSAYKKRKYREQRDRYHSLGLNAHGQPFKPGYGPRPTTMSNGPRPRNPVFVYPTPKADETPGHEAVTHTMKHCPECGCEIGRWKFV